MPAYPTTPTAVALRRLRKLMELSNKRTLKPEEQTEFDRLLAIADAMASLQRMPTK